MNLKEIRPGKIKNLSGANLSGFDLSGLDLSGLDLSYINLSGANLNGANLSEANLRGADMRGANLCGANLSGAYLNGANLSGAYLHNAKIYLQNLPAPSMILLANWGRVSDNLTTELMRLDCVHGPGTDAFNDWAAGGFCPYAGYQFQRVANFKEVEALWSPGPALDMATLARMVLNECCKIM